MITPSTIFTHDGVFTRETLPSISPPTLKRVTRGDSIFEEVQPLEIVSRKVQRSAGNATKIKRCFGLNELGKTLAPDRRHSNFSLGWNVPIEKLFNLYRMGGVVVLSTLPNAMRRAREIKQFRLLTKVFQTTCCGKRCFR